MEHVYSKDGTAIGFDRSGSGPAIIPVGGASGERSHPWMGELVALLEPHFTVFNYDRRGRGDSGDTAPYAVEREVEDLAAVIEAAGGSAFVYGMSSGAVLALDAANHGLAIPKLALYEPPFIVDDSRPPIPREYVAHLDELSAAGRRSDAVEYFMTTALGVPAEYLGPMKEDPMWAAMEKVSHTLAYDGAIMEGTMWGQPLPAERWTQVTAPTLVIAGGESEPFFHSAARALEKLLPNARRRTLPSQNHAVAPTAIMPVLVEFFKG